MLAGSWPYLFPFYPYIMFNVIRLIKINMLCSACVYKYFIFVFLIHLFPNYVPSYKVSEMTKFTKTMISVSVNIFYKKVQIAFATRDSHFVSSFEPLVGESCLLYLGCRKLNFPGISMINCQVVAPFCTRYDASALQAPEECAWRSRYQLRT